MNFLRQKYATFDADKTFAYSTTHEVVIRDRILGLTDLGFKVLILIYIIVYVMILQKGYLKVSQPTGTTRMTLRAPDYTQYRGEFSRYCDNFGASYVAGATLPCRFEPAIITVNPPSVGNTMVVTTRMNRTVSVFRNSSCTDFSDLYCKPWQWTDVVKEAYFTGGVEYSTLFVDHTVRESAGPLVKNLADMYGKLKNCDGDVLKAFSPRQPTDSNTQFIVSRTVTIAQLFQAASGTSSGCPQVTLDSRSNITTTEPYNTIRYDGGIFVMSIDYDNTQSNDQSNVEFVVNVRYLQKAEYKVEYVLGTNETAPTDFIWYGPHGILIVVTQTGKLGHFDVVTLLLQATAAMTLLAISAKITNFMATNVLPNKELYKPYMVTESQDFGELRGLVKPGQVVPGESSHLIPKPV